VLANRLSAISNTTVLLVERGPLADTWASRVPLLSSDFASDGSRTQLRTSEYQPKTGHTYELLNGSVLGGSSRINAMIYTRGLKGEYDMWKASGCPGWGWDEVKGCFLKSEKCLDARVDSDVHGTLGVWRPVFLMLFRLQSGFYQVNGVPRAPPVLPSPAFTSEDLFIPCFKPYTYPDATQNHRRVQGPRIPVF